MFSIKCSLPPFDLIKVLDISMANDYVNAFFSAFMYKFTLLNQFNKLAPLIILYLVSSLESLQGDFQNSPPFGVHCCIFPFHLWGGFVFNDVQDFRIDSLSIEGQEVAQYCSKKLPSFITESEGYKNGDLKQSLDEAFRDIDKSLLAEEVCVFNY